MTQDEIKQRHAKAKFEKSHLRFVDSMTETIDATVWGFDVGREIHFLDDGKAYNSDEKGKVMMLAEIHSGAGPGFNFFPTVGRILFVKGIRIASDLNIQRLKETAEDMLNGKDS